jgi:diguanylate cyclase (GGDEF)-like protein
LGRSSLAGTSGAAAARRRPLQSFRDRLLLLLIALVAVSQVATLAAVLASTRHNVEQQLRTELQVGGRVLRQQLQARTAQLLGSVEILTADLALREAIASRDREMIRAVLENHGARVGADLVALIGLDGRVVAATTAKTVEPLAENADAPAPLRALVARARADGQAAASGIFGDRPRQLIAVPVAAPAPIAWVAVGFAIDEAFALRFEQLTDLRVRFARELPGRPDATSGEPLLIGDQLSLDLRLDDGVGPPLHALLETSLGAALAPWRRISIQILALAGIALVLSTLAAFRFGRSLAHPVQVLVDAAHRIRAGRYETPVALRSSDEFGLLAETFNAMQRDIAEREQRIVYQAHHDALTGLPNRGSVRQRLASILARAHERQRRLALVAIDLEDFRALNDSLGHAIGDQALVAFAERLVVRSPRASLVARLGGDEFLVVLELGATEAASATAHEMIEAVAGAFVIGGELHLDIAVRAGVAEFPTHGGSVDLLLRRIDIALQDAKALHSDVHVYETGRDERHLAQLAIARDLRAATAAGAFRVHYQPKVDLLSREVVSVEALARWTHPEQGPIGPDEFIPLAERLGLIGDIGQFVLTEVLRQWRGWTDRGIHLGVAVNVSALDLGNAQLPARVRALLDAVGAPPSALTLEITESAVMQDPITALRTLDALRAAGIGLSIDDFGTGHSSLAQLKRMPVHELKIDKSFVLGLKAESEDAAIVRSIVDLGHRLGLKVVAEGVEDQTTWELLVQSRCDLAQGYLMSRPLPAAEFETWLREFQERG